MPVATRTQPEAQRRQQILSAARSVFDQKGYEIATVSDIVRMAGVAQGTFYLYFDSKKDIVVELARKPMADMADRLRRDLTGDESFEEILRQFVRTGFEVGTAATTLLTGAHEQLEVESEVMHMARGMFQRAIDAGDMSPMDPAVAIGMFHAIVSGAMQLAFATDPPPAGRQEIGRVTEEIVVSAFVARRT